MLKKSFLILGLLIVLVIVAVNNLNKFKIKNVMNDILSNGEKIYWLSIDKSKRFDGSSSKIFQEAIKLKNQASLTFNQNCGCPCPCRY